jgi:hypothetical protein
MLHTAIAATSAEHLHLLVGVICACIGYKASQTQSTCINEQTAPYSIVYACSYDGAYAITASVLQLASTSAIKDFVTAGGSHSICWKHLTGFLKVGCSTVPSAHTISTPP